MSDTSLPYLSPGNPKVGCPTWSLPCELTCKRGTRCRSYCYAKKAEALYRNALPRRTANLRASERTSFPDTMRRAVRESKAKYIRVHESGDFYSIHYIEKWYSVAWMLPDVTFYAYTKRCDLFSYMMLAAKPPNLILIYSQDGIRHGWWWHNRFMLPGQFQKEDDRMRARGFDNVLYVVGYGANCDYQRDNNLKCMAGCTRCIEKSSTPILVKKH